VLILDQPQRVNEFIRDNNGGFEPSNQFTAIGEIRNGELIGGVVFNNYNKAHVMCNIALLPQCFPRALLLAVLRYAFKQLAVKRLTFLVKSSNLRSINFVKKFGATLEATLQGADPDGDLLLFALWPENCPLWRRYE
jgi:RimJ/RimL family protein N-acetyltransferase